MMSLLFFNIVINMTVFIHQHFFINVFIVILNLKFIQTCETVGTLNDLSIRSPQNVSSYIANGSGILLSDEKLGAGWYSTVFGGWQYLVTDENNRPSVTRCSTYWSLYVKGNHPNITTMEQETPVDALAIVRDDVYPCNVIYHIKIRKCGEEIQYYLRPTALFAAYCFSKYKPVCIQFDPPTDVDFGEVVVSPELHFNDISIGPVTQHEPYIIMRCLFKMTSEYYYTVNWYVNGQYKFSLGPHNRESKDSLTFHEDYIETMGIEFQCGVRASTGKCGQQTEMTYSPTFFAGIKILNPVINLAKGNTGTIRMKITVPIGCHYFDARSDSCKESIRIFDKDDSSLECETRGTIANINTENGGQTCAKPIESIPKNVLWDPEKIYEFEIATVDENYEDATQFILQLAFDGNTRHMIWKDYLFPEVRVIINDAKAHQSKICYTHNDPHMRSGDGYYYEHHNEGAFMLFENEKYQIEVQEKTKTCINNNTATCACGVAIRAGKDVFMINRCSEGLNYLGFTQCGDGGILQVVRKNDDLYEVFTPIGTKITIALFNELFANTINIDIAMAPKDKYNTRGLCGYFDGNVTNDFKPYKLDKYPYNFTESWRLSDEKNSFQHIRDLTSWGELNGVYCKCDRQTGTTVCAASQYLHCIKPRSITAVKCRIQGRKKRNAEHDNEKEMKRLFSLMNSKSESNHKRRKRQDSLTTITVGEAVKVCTDTINGSLAVTNFTEVGGNEDPDAVIDQCAFDVEAGSDLSWAGIHLQSVNTIVKTMIEYEPTYEINHSEKVETFYINTCPGNCTGKGNCTKSSECICFKYYHGAQCTIDERDALVIDDIEGGGTCDLAEGDECVCYTIRSENVLNGFRCKVVTTLYFTNGTIETSTTVEEGDYEDVFTGGCCDTEEIKSDSVFGIVYDMSISNDGDNFSNNATVHVINSACQEVVTDNQTVFKLKEGTCFIEGSCFLDNDVSYKNNCLSCQSSNNSFDWTEENPCPTTTSTTVTSTTQTSTSATEASTMSTTRSSTTSTAPTSTTSTSPSTSTAPASTTSTSPSTSTATASTTSKSPSTPTATTSTTSTSPITPTATTSTTSTSPSTSTAPASTAITSPTRSSGSSIDNLSSSSSPQQEPEKLGLIIGLSTGVPVVILIIAVIMMLLICRYKNSGSITMHRKGIVHGDSVIPKNDTFVNEYETELLDDGKKGYKGLPVATSGHFNVEGQTFSPTAPQDSSADLSAVSVEFTKDSE